MRKIQFSISLFNNKNDSLHKKMHFPQIHLLQMHQLEAYNFEFIWTIDNGIRAAVKLGLVRVLDSTRKRKEKTLTDRFIQEKSTRENNRTEKQANNINVRGDFFSQQRDDNLRDQGLKSPPPPPVIIILRYLIYHASSKTQ